MDTAAAALKRDARVIGLVSFAHFFSHFYQLSLAPLFVMIRDDRGYSYTELGVLVGLFYVASAIFQTPAGFLVDRFGARRVLFAGLALMSLCTAGFGLLPFYPAMVVLALAAGLGNSVFHPADYSILSATVSDGRIGRGFAMHNFVGYIGFAAAPVTMVALARAWDWQSALIGAGLIGLLGLAVVMAGSGDFRDSTHARGAAGAAPQSLGQGLAGLMRAPILLCFLFFLLVAMGQIGLQNFSPTVLNEHFGFPLDFANGAVSALLIAVPVGILAGGVLADRVRRHEATIGAAIAFSALMMLTAALVEPGQTGMIVIYVLAGAAYGIAFPSRDVLVRSIAPRSGTGKVFGFVYSGLDVGSAVTPIVFGFLVDHGLPLGVFVCVAALWAVSIFVIVATARTTRGAAARPATT